MAGDPRCRFEDYWRVAHQTCIARLQSSNACPDATAHIIEEEEEDQTSQLQQRAQHSRCVSALILFATRKHVDETNGLGEH